MLFFNCLSKLWWLNLNTKANLQFSSLETLNIILKQYRNQPFRVRILWLGGWACLCLLTSPSAGCDWQVPHYHYHSQGGWLLEFNSRWFGFLVWYKAKLLLCPFLETLFCVKILYLPSLFSLTDSLLETFDYSLSSDNHTQIIHDFLPPWSIATPSSPGKHYHTKLFCWSTLQHFTLQKRKTGSLSHQTTHLQPTSANGFQNTSSY